MYLDIIPPRKNNSIRNINPERFNDIKPMAEQAYEPRRHPGHDRSFPKFFLILVLSVLVVGGVVYAKFIEHSTITFELRTHTLDIKERFPTSVQKEGIVPAEGTLYYNLIYISGKEKQENPFAPSSQTVAVATTSDPSKKNTAFTNADLKPVSVVSTSTNSTTTVYLVNETRESVPLRATTRIDVAGTIYTLPISITVLPTKDPSIFSKKQKYYLPGFKNTSSYESLYAVKTEGPLDVEEEVVTSTLISASSSTSNISSSAVPTDILSLLPKTNIALKKNTIYDKIADQAAVVVFNKKELLTTLQNKNPALQDYIKAFKSIEDIVDYEIDIVDYEIEVSSETGRPTVFKKIVLDIKPVFDIDKAKNTFAHFSLNTMEKIRSQLGDFASVQVKNTPFWKGEIAEEGKVEIIIEEK